MTAFSVEVTPLLFGQQLDALVTRPERFGALGDGVTDDYAAINAALNFLAPRGGTLLFGQAYYRLSQRLIIPANIIVQGAGAGVRNYRFGDAQSTNGWDAYTGTVFLVDADVAGVALPLSNLNSNANDVIANEGATGSNATYWQYASAEGPSIRDCVFYSKGGTNANAHGIDARCIHMLHNVLIINFPGDGYHNIANLGSSTDPYGNTSTSYLTHVKAQGSGLHGFHISGRDANICTLIGCNATGNGAWGIFDESLLGNTYVGCHFAQNNTLLRADPSSSVGSVRCDGTVARSVFFGCYVEGVQAAKLGNFCQIFGGNMAAAGRVNRNIGYVQDGDTIVESGLHHLRLDNSSLPTVASTLGPRRGDVATGTGVLSYGSKDHVAIDSQQRSVELSYSTAVMHWNYAQPGSALTEFLGHFTSLSPQRKIAATFNNGLFLGSPTTSLGPHIGFCTGTPEDGQYAVGDIRLRSAPVAAGQLGIVCVTAGQKCGTAWVTGTTYFVSTAPQLTAHVTNGGNVYRLITQGPATATVAPVHGAGTVTGADGYGWLFMNATTVPVFKDWGTIGA